MKASKRNYSILFLISKTLGCAVIASIHLGCAALDAVPLLGSYLAEQKTTQMQQSQQQYQQQYQQQLQQQYQQTYKPQYPPLQITPNPSRNILTSEAAKPLTTTPSPANAALDDLIKTRPLDLEKLFKKDIAGKNKILFLMERGRLSQLGGNIEISMDSFKKAIEANKENDKKANVSVTGAGSQVVAMLVNDKAIPYGGDGFEIVFLRHFQALNYLASGNLEGAGVEVRNANFEQEQALKKHEKEVENAKKAAEEKKVSAPAPEQNANIVSAFSVMDEAAGKVKNSFQNAYTFYMSGVIREMMNEPNDAYIDYKKALEIFPGNTYVQKDVIRLANNLEMTEELEAFTAQFPAIAKNASETLSTDGELIVLFEDGLVPQKEGISIPIPLVGGLSAVAFPIYNFKWNDPSPLVVSSGGNTAKQTEPICYVGALAVKALKERIPTMLIRQVLRSTVKGIATKVASDQLGELGTLAASVYNVLSEQADTRCWISLPENAQIMRTSLPAGNHVLSLGQNESGASGSVQIETKVGQKNILRVIRIGNNLVCQPLWPAVQTASESNDIPESEANPPAEASENQPASTPDEAEEDEDWNAPIGQ